MMTHKTDNQHERFKRSKNPSDNILFPQKLCFKTKSDYKNHYKKGNEEIKKKKNKNKNKK